LGREYRAPLVAAVEDGVRLSDTRALVASGADLFEIDLTSGLPVSLRALPEGFSARTLFRVSAGETGLFALVSAGPKNPWSESGEKESATSLLALSASRRNVPLAELQIDSVPRPVGASGAPIVSATGGVLWLGPCEDRASPPRDALASGQFYPVCVRSRSGTIRTIFLVDFPKLQVTPTAEGHVVLLSGARAPQVLLRFDTESQMSVIDELPTLVAGRSPLDEIQPGVVGQFVRVFGRDASVRAPPERAFLRVAGGNATLTPIPPGPEGAMVAQQRHALLSLREELRVSEDGGATWRTVPPPPPSPRRSAGSTLAIGEVGCTRGGWVRIGCDG
jgi:hypothetical protein